MKTIYAFLYCRQTGATWSIVGFSGKTKSERQIQAIKEIVFLITGIPFTFNTMETTDASTFHDDEIPLSMTVECYREIS